MRALVTGFEAFGGDTVNASLAALQKLPTHVSGVAITTLELPTSFARAPAVLAAAITQYQPDIVLCTGEAGERNALCIGTTCTVTSRTSDRKRFSTEPRSRISQRERADWPNTTCEMFSRCAK